jgi:glycosyltransferase involved in cell wall biosynthesis
VRNFLATSDVVVVPSRRTSTFREPWGLVVNESMHAGTPVIATDQVGAAAGGLIRNGRNGLVVPSEDPAALAAALRLLRDDPELRERLGAAAREDVARYTFEAWSEGFAAVLPLA